MGEENVSMCVACAKDILEGNRYTKRQRSAPTLKITCNPQIPASHFQKIENRNAWNDHGNGKPTRRMANLDGQLYTILYFIIHQKVIGGSFPHLWKT